MPISKELREHLETVKPVNGARKPVYFNRIIYGASGTRSVVAIKRTYAQEPLISHEDGHEEDTGWYFPVESETIAMGNRQDYENQISQSEFQRIRQAA